MSEVNPRRLSRHEDADLLLEALYEIDDRDTSLRAEVAALLEHEDPDVRAEAVRILIRRWKDREARPVAFDLLTSDPDDEVREAAAYALAGSGTPETRDRDTEALLSVVQDKGLSLGVRAAAYDGLLILYRRPRFPTKHRAFDPTSDVDWEWLRTLRTA